MQTLAPVASLQSYNNNKKNNFCAKIPYASDKAAVDATFNIFSFDAVKSENQTHHLTNAEQLALHVTPRSRGRYLLRRNRTIQVIQFIGIVKTTTD